MRTNSVLGVMIVAGLLTMPPQTSQAHWCSNIYQTYARIVVKPERQNINVGVGETGELKVRVRNNFPYTLNYIKLRANNPSGLNVCVCPDEDEAENIRVHAGEEITFTLTINRHSASGDDLSVLNMEVATRVEDIGGSWRDMGDWWVDQDPDPATVRNTLQNNPAQSRALLNGNLADLALQGCPSCETDGVTGLQQLWHSRLDPCTPNGFDSQWPMMYMRAGQHLAIRLRFRNFNDPSRASVVTTMIEAMDDANEIARGYAAFLAAYGGNDAGVETRIQAMADTDPDGGACSYSTNAQAQRMARAALYVLGHNQHYDDINACWNDGGEHERVRMVCAAALGLMGEDAPMTNYLISRIGNGTNTNYERLYGSYLFQLVVLARRGGPEGEGEVSFLNEADMCFGQGYEEVCDGADNDCDGEVDEDIVGSPCPLQDGVCARSGETCDGAGGWNPCGPASYGPDYEQNETSCDGLDNDCDGQADNGLNAPACALQDGICAGSTEVCAGAGGWQACDYGPDYQQNETLCDGLDNDCDGQADNGLNSPACPLQQGVCTGAVQRCGGAGGWLACDGADYGGDYEQDELTCDSLDNDCDGSTDEGVAACCQQGETQPCSTDEGECEIGEQGCDANGAWGACDGVMPANEDCDGLDNDCDGDTDNGLAGAACPLQDGVCAGTAQQCNGAGGWTPCDASTYGADYEAAETRCDGLDNDCDGQADEDLGGPACAFQDGVCAGSTQACDGAGGWRACDGATYGADYEADETRCDNMDNDCNGQVDEDGVCDQPDGGEDGGEDGGVDGGEDAGTDAGADQSATDEDEIVIKGGCGCASTGPGTEAGLWLFGLLAWALFRRRHAGDRHNG